MQQSGTPHPAIHSPAGTDRARLPHVPLSQRFLEVIRSESDLVPYLRGLKESGELSTLSPELVATFGERGLQDARWHPEGTTWDHTLLVVAALPKESSFALKLAAIFHDVGKPLTYFRYPDSGGIANHGHAHVGAELFRSTIGPRLRIGREDIEVVASIIDYHMLMHDALNPAKVSEELLLTILKLPFAREMIELQHADAMGTGQALEERLRRSNRAELRKRLGAGN